MSAFMTSHLSWRICAFAAPIIVLGLYLLPQTACPVPVALLTEDKLQPPCIEFWLNLYQTFLGVIAAIFAAWITWRSTKRQIERSDDQIRIAQIQFSSSYMENIRSRIIHSKQFMVEVIDYGDKYKTIYNRYTQLLKDTANLSIRVEIEMHMTNEEVANAIERDIGNFNHDFLRFVREFGQFYYRADRLLLGKKCTDAVQKLMAAIATSNTEAASTSRYLLNALKVLCGKERYLAARDPMFGPNKSISCEGAFVAFFRACAEEQERLQSLYFEAARRADQAITD